MVIIQGIQCNQWYVSIYFKVYWHATYSYYIVDVNNVNTCKLWYYLNYWLVVWNMNFIAPFGWESHHPNWQSHIFQRGSNHQTDYYLQQPDNPDGLPYLWVNRLTPGKKKWIVTAMVGQNLITWPSVNYKDWMVKHYNLGVQVIHTVVALNNYTVYDIEL